jgi:RHS repeat-associated protein
LWARDDSGQSALSERERIEYGDGGNRNQPQTERDANRANNRLGRPSRHYDEAGFLAVERYDFKGNLTRKIRRVVADSTLVVGWHKDWSAVTPGNVLDQAGYQTDIRFDALNRPTSVTYPADVVGHRAEINPTYNRAGTLEKVKLDADLYVERIVYNAKGQRVFIAYGNNIMTRYAYDPRTFRLVRLRTERYTKLAALNYKPAGGVLQDFVYEYDLSGNVVRMIDRVPGGGFINNPDPRVADPQLRLLLVQGDALVRYFEYDPSYRLTRATGRESKNITSPRSWPDDPRNGFNSGNHGTPTQDNASNLTSGYWESYAYDPAGNIVELKHGTNGVPAWTRHFGMGGRTPQQWDQDWRAHLNTAAGWSGPPSNRLNHVGDDQITFAATHRFDANGNMIQENTERHFSWDYADRMAAFKVQPQNAGQGSIEARYLYGADGTRVKKWVRKNANGSNDESTVYIDAIFEHHRWSDGGTPKENNHLHVTANQSRIAIVRVGDRHANDGGEKIQYHLGDHLGSSAVVIAGDASNANNFVNREEYFPYGETSFSSFAKKRYRYAGEERDEESGLYYFGARYFIPALARWVNCDPSGPEDSANLFQIAQNNPLRFTDSMGTKSVDISSVRPEPVFSRKFQPNQLPQRTKEAYKLLHQYGFASEIKRDFLGGKSYERRVPDPYAKLEETAEQVNKRTECVPSTIRNYLRVILRYDFPTEGIEELMITKATKLVSTGLEGEKTIPHFTGDISKSPTGMLGRLILNDLLPERNFFYREVAATEENLVALARKAQASEPMIIQLPHHWYLLEGVEVVNGKNMFKVRDSLKPDQGFLTWHQVGFTGGYVDWDPSPSYSTYEGIIEASKHLRPPPPPADLTPRDEVRPIQ